MNTERSSNQGTLAVASGTLTFASLLERGIHYTRRGYYDEGASFFALAREQLAESQLQLVAVLDALIHSSTDYLQAQQALLLASRQLVEVDARQQIHLGNLEKLLPVLNEAIDQIPQLDISTRQPENSQELQSQPFSQASQHEASSEQASRSPEPVHKVGDALPALDFTCFGHFEVRRLGKAVDICSNRNGQAVLRYLVAQPGHSATVDTLMALLWPEDGQEVAQSKLHIAISALRRSLNEGFAYRSDRGYILCKNRVYCLDASVEIKTDVGEFLHYYQAGRQANKGRASLYERACRLYAGPFLLEDIYADWSSLQREQLSQTYLAMCKTLADHYFVDRHYEDAAQWATAILKENRCDEDAHRQLMLIYAAQGRRTEALQQYQRCIRVLREELGVQPLPETVLAFQTLLANEPHPGR